MLFASAMPSAARRAGSEASARGGGREIRTRTKGRTRPPRKRATAGLRRATGSPETRRTQRPGVLGRGRLLGGGGVSTRSQPQVKTPAGPHDEMLRSRGEPRSTGCRTSNILPPVLGSALLTFRWQSGPHPCAQAEDVTSVHDGNTEQTNNRRKIPRPGKGHA